MAVRVTPVAAADLYVERIGNAVPRIEAGVRAVTVSPTESAAGAQAKMRQNIIAAIDNGSWAKGLRRVSLQQWKDAFINKGLLRIASGAADARPKMVTFYTALFAHQNDLLLKVESMPNVTLEQSIARMVAWVKGMANFNY